jgi:Tol biopolymer transport system component
MRTRFSLRRPIHVLLTCVCALGCAGLLLAATGLDDSTTEPLSATEEFEIVFVSDMNSRGRDLFRISVAGGEPRRISNYKGPGHYPHHNWPASTLQGDWIAYMSDTDGHDNYAIWIARPDGSDAQRMTPRGREGLYPSWSRDGKRLAFTGRTSTGWQLFVVDRDGGNLRQVTSFSGRPKPSWGMSSTWAPGDDTIVFDSDHAGPWSLYSIELDDGTLSPLGSQPVPGRRPAFSPDGRQLAFINRSDGTSRIWITAPDGSDGRSMGVISVKHSSPAWSPDGRRIAFTAMTSDASADLFIVDVDGNEGEYDSVFSSPGYDAFPCWVRVREK